MIFFAVLLCASILILLHIHDFGGAWDEPPIYDYAAVLPEIYIKAAQGQIFDHFQWYGDLRYYGPAYFLIGELGTRALRIIFHLELFDAWHIMNYLVFTMGAIALYRLCQKFTGPGIAMLTALLYFSQPVFLGHGIMNPKDGAFASFFLLAVTLGMHMVDCAIEPCGGTSSFLPSVNRLIKTWYARVGLVILLFILIDRIGDNFLLIPLASAALSAAMAWVPSARLLELAFFSGGWGYVTNQHSAYVNRMVANLNLAGTLCLALGCLALIILFLHTSNRFHRSIFWAGVALGMVCSVRILGPAAGVMILLIWILQQKSKGILVPALTYLGVAGVTMFLTWPFLWKAPLLRLIETLQFMSLPWSGPVLFNGTYYPSSALPWNYLITLIPIQITLPALLLALAGIGWATRRMILSKGQNAHLLLPVIWFFPLLLAWMLIRPATYDNFRHFLFILPPLFLFAGSAMEEIFRPVEPRVIKTILGILILTPGLIASLILHPFQYTYYNAIVGWTPGIYNRFEADYWGTSMCAAAQRLDNRMDNQTRIYFTDQNLGRLFARCTQQTPQIIFQQGDDPDSTPDYAVILARWGYERTLLPHMPQIYSIHIGDTPLAVIRERPQHSQ